MTKDFEEEVCVGKQNMKSKKKRSTSVSLLLSFLCVQSTYFAQNTALWVRWQFLLSFLFMMNEESQKGVCLQDFHIRNPCFLVLSKHYKGGKSVRARYKDRIEKKIWRDV